MRKYPSVSVTFIIEFKSKFLLVCRGSKEDNFPSLWAFPGGKVEADETIIDTIRREVKEETNLSLTDEAAFLDSYFFKGRVGVAFLVRATSADVLLSEELIDYRWITTIDEMRDLNCIPGIYNHLQRAHDVFNANILDSLEQMNLTESKYINRK